MTSFLISLNLPGTNIRVFAPPRRCLQGTLAVSGICLYTLNPGNSPDLGDFLSPANDNAWFVMLEHCNFKRNLFSEYNIFLADIFQINYLPQSFSTILNFLSYKNLLIIERIIKIAHDSLEFQSKEIPLKCVELYLYLNTLIVIFGLVFL